MEQEFDGKQQELEILRNQLKDLKQKEEDLNNIMVIRQKEWEDDFKDLKRVKQEILDLGEKENQEKEFWVDKNMYQEYKDLEKIVMERKLKIEKLEEEQRVTQYVDPKLIQLRDKYRVTAKEYEQFRQHLESEHTRSQLDQPTINRIYYEQLNQELQRKSKIYANLIEEKKKFDETISQFQQGYKEFKAKSLKYDEELKKWNN